MLLRFYFTVHCCIPFHGIPLYCCATTIRTTCPCCVPRRREPHVCDDERLKSSQNHGRDVHARRWSATSLCQLKGCCCAEVVTTRLVVALGAILVATHGRQLAGVDVAAGVVPGWDTASGQVWHAPDHIDPSSLPETMVVSSANTSTLRPYVPAS